MKRQFFTAIALLFSSYAAFAQTKPVIGVAFRSNGADTSAYQSTIQNTVEDAFIRSKRFTLVERGEMDQVKAIPAENAEVEKMKDLGAQYLLIGNVVRVTEDQKESKVPVLGTTVTPQAEVIYTVRIIDVNTGEVTASGNFDNIAKGKNAFSDALNGTRGKLEKFIKDNFKLTASIASIEEKTAYGDASKVLLTAGKAVETKEGDEFKVYQVVEVNVDGKKLTRKKTIGRIVVAKVEDEHFSICTVLEGATEITKLVTAGSPVKCELTAEAPKKLFFQK
ncbi:CsgG/HfaB family protein [Chitinophaga sp. Cy-1792]|uniref:CsgG/HfaB family protein n=1 Tax=Chitinophaga sp. Cy-1792 TaxID=2608339 RepID=UPI00141F1015|nr:CsgG/HfaB family protein [Chitinophaga sp. Cy-1792]NIG53405.1 hypothetical protein [Chitinophaga sp. Cy-1792]